MINTRRFFRTPAVAATAFVALALSGAAAEHERPRRSISALISIDALIDNYVHVLARKYNLTDEQDVFTQQFVHAKVDQFLARHHDEVSELVDRLFDVRSGGDMTPEELVEWGGRVQPIYQEIKRIVVDGNAEWREILSDEQQQIHDEDLRLMYESFATTEDQLVRIVSGTMTVEEFRHPPRPVRSPQGQAVVRPAPRSVTPAGPADHTVTLPDHTTVPPRTPVVTRPRPQPVRSADGPAPATAGIRQREPTGRPPDRTLSPRTARPSPVPGRTAGDGDYAGAWEKYVRDFIARYNLNAEQQERAMKILRACQQQAHGYLRTRQPQIDRLDRQLAELQGAVDKEKVARRSKIEAERRALIGGVNEIFEKQLKPRLERIPTRALREAAERGARRAAPAGRSQTPARPAEPPAPEPAPENYDEPPEEPEDD